MPTVLRIIDANANRAREALRVMEEAARFILDDSDLTKSIKTLRHDLAAALSLITNLEQNRNTPGDVGTTISTKSELTRTSVAQVTIAAGKRLSEALRAMEEYGKTLGQAAADFPQQIESIRYRGYDVEQKLICALATTTARQWKLCVLISENLCPNGDWLNVAKSAIAGGADCIQLREKSLDAGPLLDRAKQLVKLCHKNFVTAIINDRPDVALASGADGVHLGQSDLPITEARKIFGSQLILGLSTSNIEQAIQAQKDGADYCGLGPMFHTTTKHKKTIVGPDYAREYLNWNKLPHLAIGGIDTENINQLTNAGVKGIAVSSTVCNAQNPTEVTQNLIAQM